MNREMETLARESTDTEVQRLAAIVRCDQAELARVLQAEKGSALLAALQNPRCGVDDLKRLLRRPDLETAVVSAVLRHQEYDKCRQCRLLAAAHPHIRPHDLQQQLGQLYLFELLSLLQGSSPVETRLAAERTILQRLPTTPLGNLVTLARRASPALLTELLLRSEPAIIAACLDNPRLHEISILQALARPQATATALTSVARHPRWQSLPAIRQAIARHPRTPLETLRPLLSSLCRNELKSLQTSGRHPAERRRLFSDEYARRQG